MSGRSDTLVLKIVETNKNGNKQNCTYVLYDQALSTVLVRGGYSMYNNNNDHSDYSFYCNSDYDVKDLLDILFGSFYELGISLVNYKNLPCISDNITYKYLKENDSKINEIVGFDYRRLLGGNFENINIEKYLNTLKNVYNDFIL
jgi:hypothetical protein